MRPPPLTDIKQWDLAGSHNYWFYNELFPLAVHATVYRECLWETRKNQGTQQVWKMQQRVQTRRTTKETKLEGNSTCTQNSVRTSTQCTNSMRLMLLLQIRFYVYVLAVEVSEAVQCSAVKWGRTICLESTCWWREQYCQVIPQVRVQRLVIWLPRVLIK